MERIQVKLVNLRGVRAVSPERRVVRLWPMLSDFKIVEEGTGGGSAGDYIELDEGSQLLSSVKKEKASEYRYILDYPVKAPGEWFFAERDRQGEIVRRELLKLKDKIVLLWPGKNPEVDSITGEPGDYLAWIERQGGMLLAVITAEDYLLKGYKEVDPGVKSD